MEKKTGGSFCINGNFVEDFKKAINKKKKGQCQKSLKKD